MKIKGDNGHGFKNEHNIVVAINNKKFSSLNLNFKEFIKTICIDNKIELKNDTVIRASEVKNSKFKQDIYICIECVEIGVSLKIGTGNSVHQEKCEDFIEYLKSNVEVTDEICNAWRLFIWADGTYDGKGDLKKNEDGEIISRIPTRKFKTIYSNERLMLINFIKKNESRLINHFLFEGRHNSKVDYIYHGTYEKGVWISDRKSVV